jgi:hypothetical protein
MRTWLTIISTAALTIFFITTGWAQDATSLRGPMANSTPHPAHICMPNQGCFNLLETKQGKAFIIETASTLDRIYFFNHGKHQKMYLLELPKHCQMKIKAGQTMILTGEIGIGKTKLYQIYHLSCVLS